MDDDHRVQPYCSGTRTTWADYYRATGQLYGDDHDEVEAIRIRAECEEAGLPMGYGRVGRVPVQLTPKQAEPWRKCARGTGIDWRVWRRPRP